MKVEHRQFHSMGTRMDLVLAGLDARTSNEILRKVEAECMRIEKLLSVYRSDSALSRLNATAGTRPVVPDRELYGILSEAADWHRETGGFFDISLKPLSDLLRTSGGAEPGALERIGEITGMNKVRLEGGSVRFSVPGVSLDLGGYGKGYAVSRILPILEESGVEHALVSFGDSLVYARGSHPYGKGWKLSLPVPGGEEQSVFVLKDEALSTSGNSLNNRKKFGNSGHIVNPLTRKMNRLFGLVSVKAADPVRAEVYSTALFSAGPERSKDLIRNSTGLEARWLIAHGD
jgi:thiamine biosynthesis lipoprotein